MISSEGEDLPQPRVMLSSFGDVSSAYWKADVKGLEYRIATDDPLRACPLDRKSVV